MVHMDRLGHSLGADVHIELHLTTPRLRATARSNRKEWVPTPRPPLGAGSQSSTNLLVRRLHTDPHSPSANGLLLRALTSVDPPYTRPIHAGHVAGQEVEVPIHQKPLEAPRCPAAGRFSSNPFASEVWEERTGGTHTQEPRFFMARWDYGPGAGVYGTMYM